MIWSPFLRPAFAALPVTPLTRTPPSVPGRAPSLTPSGFSTAICIRAHTPGVRVSVWHASVQNGERGRVKRGSEDAIESR
jgi:hypothetical protein